jgi:flavin-dependent dehydrogenase
LKKVIIVGGGLAGLISGIQLAKAGIEVILFERKRYPLHRVCGEFVSNETVPFLKANEIYPDSFALSSISRFQLTSVNGKSVDLKLNSGGFGISRYSFDHFLFEKAKQAGVIFQLDTEVEEIKFEDEQFILKTNAQTFYSDLVIGSFGKRSRIDVALQRNFIRKHSPYAGVKYHIKINHPHNLIALHNFKNGYCGVSGVEDGKTNLCYLTHRDNLKKFKSIAEMEKAILYQNPFLKDIFQNAEFLFDKPLVINEISFETKSPVENHILMAGDAAGMITPLCGNGMAIAIHSAKMIGELAIPFCFEKMNRMELEDSYRKRWNSQFASRLWVGRQIQNLFGSSRTSDFAVNLARYAKPIANYLVSKTHGDPF